MAATAVYASATKIPRTGGTVGSSVAFSNISATTGAFSLYGGEYAVAVKASTYGTVTLQTLGPDNVTWLQAVTPFAADAVNLADLPPGQYRFAVA